MISPVCGGKAWSFVQQNLKMLPACFGCDNAGKTERGEINIARYLCSRRKTDVTSVTNNARRKLCA